MDQLSGSVYHGAPESRDVKRRRQTDDHQKEEGTRGVRVLVEEPLVVLAAEAVVMMVVLAH